MFANLFGRIPYMASMGTKLYLPSSAFSSGSSDTGFGYVSDISWSEMPKLREEVEEEPATPPVYHQAEQTQTLAQIASYLKWLLWLAAAAVVVLAFKH